MVFEIVSAFLCAAVGAVIGPAFGRVSLADRPSGIPLEHIHDHAASRSFDVFGGLFRWLGKSRSSSSSMSEGDSLVVTAMSCIFVVSLYLRYRVPVIAVILALSMVLAVASITSLVRLSRAGAVSGRGVAWALVSGFGACMVGILNVIFLWSPPAGGS